MKKNVLRVLAIALALSVLVMAFAACGPKDLDTDESSNSVSEEATTDDVTTDTTKEGDTTDTTKEGDTTTAKQGDTAKPGVNPTDKAGMIAAFNGAGLKASAFNRNMTVGTINVTGPAIGNVDVDLLGEDVDLKAKVQRIFNSTNAATAGVLPKLTDGQVKSATISGDTMTIVLNDASAAANGEGGYPSVINFEQAKVMIDDIADGFPIPDTPIKLARGDIKVGSMATKMTGGKYVVKISAGKVTNVQFSATQTSDLNDTVVSKMGLKFKGTGKISATVSGTFS